MKPWSDSKLQRLAEDELRDESHKLEQDIRAIRYVRLQIAQELDRRTEPVKPSPARQIVTPARVESEARVGGLRRFFGG